MMKKIIVAMALMLGFQMSQAQTVNGIFREFRYKENAEYVNVPKILMDVVKWAQRRTLEAEEINPMVEKINSVEVLDLTECDKRVQERFSTKVEKLKMNGYEPLMAMNDDETHAKIWAKIEDEKATDIVIVASGNGTYVLCSFKGELSMGDIQKLVERK